MLFIPGALPGKDMKKLERDSPWRGARHLWRCPAPLLPLLLLQRDQKYPCQLQGRPFPSGIAPVPAPPPLCRVALEGSTPCLGEELSAAQRVFLREGCVGLASQQGCHSLPQAGPSRCSSTCHTGTSWVCRSHAGPGAAEKRPTADMEAAGGFAHSHQRASTPWGHRSPPK